jgi:hypothetical protein
MRTEDFKINARVRSVLVRRYVDTSKCIFSTIKGRVYIRGQVRRLFGHVTDFHQDANNPQSGEKTPDDYYRSELALLLLLEQEILKIPGVSGVQFDLKDWEKDKGSWKRKISGS